MYTNCRCCFISNLIINFNPFIICIALFNCLLFVHCVITWTASDLRFGHLVFLAAASSEGHSTSLIS